MATKMTVVEIVAEVLKAHRPALTAEAGVTMLCYDGEVNYTKGGDIFGMRSMHVQHAGFLDLISWCEDLEATLKAKMPQVLGVARIVCTEDDAIRLRNYMWDYATNKHGVFGEGYVTNEAINLMRRIQLMERLMKEMVEASTARHQAARNSNVG